MSYFCHQIPHLNQSKGDLDAVFSKEIARVLPNSLVSLLLTCKLSYFAILILVFRWTDVFLLRTFLEAASYDGNPLEKLSKEMQWFISFTSEEISDLQQLLSILGPMEELFYEAWERDSFLCPSSCANTIGELIELSLPLEVIHSSVSLHSVLVAELQFKLSF